MTTDNMTATAPELGFGAVPTTGRLDAVVAEQARKVAPPASSLVARDALAPLPQALFAAQLRREMRRADRSGSSLSLALFGVAPAADAESILSLCTTLQECIRETDVLGFAGKGIVGVICPDTGDTGLQSFVSKVEGRLGGIGCSIDSGTYPDDLFNRISCVPGDSLPENPILASAAPAAPLVAYPLKRPLDIVGALVAILLFSPVMLLTAAAVRLGSPGPVIFRQTRLGQGGRPFSFYKFRSMFVNGDDRIHRQYVEKLIKGEHAQIDQADGAGGQPMYKMVRDPRITWVGRIIRRTSIDELPQLFNVLKGDMSLVGPRPPLPYEAQNYQSWHLRRVLEVQPGITGLWQVEGRSKVTFDEMVRMDLRYVRDCSLTLDLQLLMRTARVVMRCDGAT